MRNSPRRSARSQQDADTKIGAVSTDLTGAKGDITATKQDLEATKAKLTSTVGDLGVQSGLIARNQEELDQLKRQGERNIFELHLTKSKTPTHVGPIQVTLTKTDPKKFKYTLMVIADDKTIEKKDKTADEPVQFYIHGVPRPYEIVVFDVTKDKVNGYLSTPKDAGRRTPSSRDYAPHLRYVRRVACVTDFVNRAAFVRDCHWNSD